jgi:hypothetical protein
MKRIAIFTYLISTLTLLSCSCGEVERTEDEFYLDTDFVLVQKTEKPSENDPYIEFIIRTQEEPYMYRTLSNGNGNCCNGFNIDRDMFHKYEVGDKLHFDYLVKSEFFTKSKDILLPSDRKVILDDYKDDYNSSNTSEPTPTEEEKELGDHTFTEPTF